MSLPFFTEWLPTNTYLIVQAVRANSNGTASMSDSLAQLARTGVQIIRNKEEPGGGGGGADPLGTAMPMPDQPQRTVVKTEAGVATTPRPSVIKLEGPRAVPESPVKVPTYRIYQRWGELVCFFYTIFLQSGRVADPDPANRNL